jgi:hypothetical protein
VGVSDTRTALSTDRFLAAWAEGRVLSLEAVISELLA